MKFQWLSLVERLIALGVRRNERTVEFGYTSTRPVGKFTTSTRPSLFENSPINLALYISPIKNDISRPMK
jgi:site-specific recombinase XerD